MFRKNVLASITSIVLGSIVFAAPASAHDAKAQVAKSNVDQWCSDLYWGSGDTAMLRGQGCFAHYGDYLIAWDLHDSDNMYIRVDSRTDYGRDDACTDGKDPKSDVCNFNMREDGRIKFQIELRRKGSDELVAESKWYGWYPIDGK